MGCKRRYANPRMAAHLNVNVAIHVHRIGGGVDSYYYHNLKTSGYLDMLRDAATGSVSDVKVKYMAWGTGTTPPSMGQTMLVAEAGRKQVTRTTTPSSGVCIITTILNTNDANGVAIGEFGLFAGTAASSTQDSGVLVARVVWDPPHTKTSAESIQVDWQLQYT